MTHIDTRVGYLYLDRPVLIGGKWLTAISEQDLISLAPVARKRLRSFILAETSRTTMALTLDVSPVTMKKPRLTESGFVQNENN